MRPDWIPITPGDPLYDAQVPKWAASAYGHDDLRDVPTTGPDDHVTPTYWTITRVPNTNTPDARFIAIKAVA